MSKRVASIALVAVILGACRDAFDTTPTVPSSANVSQSATAPLVELKFIETLQIRADPQGRLRSEVGADLTVLQAVLDALSVSEVQPLITVPQDKLAALLADARRLSPGEDPPDMLSWHRLVLPVNANLSAIIDRLSVAPEIQYVYRAPIDFVPPPVTPDFSPNQANYFGPAPSGTEQLYARSQPGGRGVGVEVVDIEYAWNFSHEDLLLSPSILIWGQQHLVFGNDHGTAVLGILVGRDNGFGITGGVPDATIRVAGAVNNGVRNVASAVTNASSRITPGDVILIEQQEKPNLSDTNYIPVEWIQATFDAIRLATQAGRIVVEAAGNGGRNLDAPIYGGKFNRSQRNSRAIIVGAGDANNARRPSSTYGSRVDVQAHGTSVTTSGYGGLFGEAPNELYTSGFTGTSSASAIVAAAVVTLSGYRKYLGKGPLTPSSMATILKSYSSPQTGDLSTHIGPKPNVQAAMAALNSAPLSATWTGVNWYVGHNDYCPWVATVTGGTPPYSYSWYAYWSSSSTGFYFTSGQGTANATSFSYYYDSYPNPTSVTVYLSGGDAVGESFYLERTIDLYNYPAGCH